MDLLDRYLNAVAAQLPTDERADIVAELRDLILSRFEAKEEAQGRPLTDDEREDILREIGHPLAVAGRYRKGPQSLIGPELFPYWMFGMKAGLMVLGAVFALTLLINLVTGASDAGQAIAHTFHGFFGAGLTLIGALTLAGAIFEHQGVRPAFLSKWRVRDLDAFQLADPARWGIDVKPGDVGKPASVWTGRKTNSGYRWPGADYLASFIATGVFVLWWVGVLHFPGMMQVGLRGEDATVTAAPIWGQLHGAILLYALGQMAIDLASLISPYAVRLRAAAQAAIAGVGLWLTWLIFEAGHWFTLHLGTESARIAGDRTMLNFDVLRTLGDGARDLIGVSSTLSVVVTWIIAVSALGLVAKLVKNLWRMATGRS
jgi:hypothetical protein